FGGLFQQPLDTERRPDRFKTMWHKRRRAGDTSAAGPPPGLSPPGEGKESVPVAGGHTAGGSSRRSKAGTDDMPDAVETVTVGVARLLVSGEVVERVALIGDLLAAVCTVGDTEVATDTG